jgi:CheY-like chemotaxis protein
MTHFQSKAKRPASNIALGTQTQTAYYTDSMPLRAVVKGATTAHSETIKATGPTGKQTGNSALTGADKTVMVVDDDVLVNELTTQLLERFGYSVRTAFSGEEALGLYKDHKSSFDLVMLDLSMPGMGGYDCLCELVQFDPSVRVIITSGYSDDEKKQETLQAGAAGFVGKPYQASDLIKAVNSALENGKILENQG